MSFTRHKYIDDASKLDSLANPAATIKYDGGNYFMQIDHEGKPSFISRRESVKGGYPNKTAKVPHLAELRFPEFKGHEFNVELIHTGFDPKARESHPVVSGILNSLPPKAIASQALLGPIRAVLFDVTSPSIPTFKEKLALLKKVEETINKPDLLFVPEVKIGRDAIKQLLAHTTSTGREGIVATDLELPESENPRIKVKHVQTANLRVKELVQEVDKNGQLKESTGAYILEDSTGRIVGSVGSGLTREERIQTWGNKERTKGRLVQVKFRTVTSHGMLREPVYNGEADGDCDKI